MKKQIVSANSTNTQENTFLAYTNNVISKINTRKIVGGEDTPPLPESEDSEIIIEDLVDW